MGFCVNIWKSHNVENLTISLVRGANEGESTNVSFNDHMVVTAENLIFFSIHIIGQTLKNYLIK